MTGNLSNQKEQWAPIWIGLVADKKAKHYQRMKNAIWLFLYLVINADRRGRVLDRKIGTIGSEMGIKRDTIIRWLNILRKHGYIRTRNTGRALIIQIISWENLLSGSGKCPFQEQKIPNTTSRTNPTAETTFERLNPLSLSRKSAYLSGPIDLGVNPLIFRF